MRVGNGNMRSTKTVSTTVQGVDQRARVLMTRAGPEYEIVILAAVSVAAVPAHVAIANLLGIH